MKRTSIFLLCVFMSVLICSCTQQGATGKSVTPESSPPQATTQPGGQSKPIEPEKSAPPAELKVKVDPPEGWAPVEGSALPAHYMKNDSAVLMVTKQGYAGDTIDSVTAAAQAANEKAYENVTYEAETESIKVDGKEARKFVFTYEFSKLKMKSMSVYLFVGDDLYNITFSDFSDSFDSLSDDYSAILANIKFE